MNKGNDQNSIIRFFNAWYGKISNKLRFSFSFCKESEKLG